MKKIVKTSISLLFAAMLVLALTGCSEDAPVFSDDAGIVKVTLNGRVLANASDRGTFEYNPDGTFRCIR